MINLKLKTMTHPRRQVKRKKGRKQRRTDPESIFGVAEEPVKFKMTTATIAAKMRKSITHRHLSVFSFRVI